MQDYEQSLIYLKKFKFITMASNSSLVDETEEASYQAAFSETLQAQITILECCTESCTPSAVINAVSDIIQKGKDTELN